MKLRILMVTVLVALAMFAPPRVANSMAASQQATPTCGDGHWDRQGDDQTDEECDGTDDYDCRGTCRADCTCPNQAARITLEAYLAEMAGHDPGLFPLSTREPVLGQAAYILARVHGPYATATFRFVDQNGQDIAPLSLTKHGPHATLNEYVGHVQLPTQPFRIAASGTTRDGSSYDVNGKYFDRELYTPQPINITLVNRTGKPVAGSSMTVQLGLTNVGPPDTFNLSVSDTLGLASLATPSTVTLATGDTATVTVVLSGPSSAPSRWSVTLTATGVTNTNTHNSISLPVE